MNIYLEVHYFEFEINISRINFFVNGFKPIFLTHTLVNLFPV